jgi:hypothetical protein
VLCEADSGKPGHAKRAKIKGISGQPEARFRVQKSKAFAGKSRLQKQKKDQKEQAHACSF